MTTEKHDPWALLREARDFMRQAAISRGPCPDCTECDHRDAIIAKADAALAAHDAREATFRRERDDAVLAAIVARGG